MYCLQELPQPFPKYLAPPGTTIPAEYMQVIPPYTQLNDIVQQYSCKIQLENLMVRKNCALLIIVVSPVEALIVAHH